MKAIVSSLKIGVVMALCLYTQWSFSQRNDVPKDKTGTYAKPGRMVNFPVSCDPLPQVSCNIIRNNDFDPQTYSDDPFSTNLLPPWQTASGSCTVYPGANTFPFAPPAPATSYVFGYAGYYDSYGQYACESIVQKIPNVIPGHTYVLSFFISHRDYSNNPYIGVDYPLDHFNIHLINCDDYNETFTPNSFVYPTVPANSQQIYCQDNVANHAWKRVFVHFVARQPNPLRPLNMLWIWPEGDPDPAKHSGMFVALPELFDITNYTNQVQQAANPGCLATLPSCGPEGSVFTWTGPAGSTIVPPTPAGTPVTLDVVSNPLNIGTWTLTLSVPGAHITTGACNTTGSFTTTVEVLACGILPTGPIKIIEVPNVQSASPKDVMYSFEWPGYSLVAYTSIADITLPDPDDQVVGFGLMKLDANCNNIFNKQYTLPGKKLYVKKIIERNVGNDNHYYALLGIKDGITCTCSDEKILILKIDKTTGNLVSSYKVDGFYSTAFHEPVTIGFSYYSDQNDLYITSYGYDQNPTISNSKIFLTRLNLSTGQNQVYEIYDANNTGAILKPTQFSNAGLNSNNNQFFPYPYIEIGVTYQSAAGQPLQPLFVIGGDLTQGQATVFTLDNGSLATANFGVEDFGYSFLFIAQNTDKKIYVVTSPMNTSGITSHVYNNPDFTLSSGVIDYDNYSDYRYANGIITSNPTLYSRLNYDRLGQNLASTNVGQNLNINSGSTQNIFTANIDPDFSLPGTIVAQKQPLVVQDYNKFYYYYSLPTNCDIPVNFPEITGTVTKSANNTKMHLSNFAAQITNVSMTEAGSQPINITQICYDFGSFTDGRRKKPIPVSESLQTNRQVSTPVNIKLQSQNSVQQETRSVTNIKSIDLLSTTGQLVKRIGFPYEINSIMNNRAVGVVPGLYFIRVLYNDKTTKTLKKFLQ